MSRTPTPQEHDQVVWYSDAEPSAKPYVAFVIEAEGEYVWLQILDRATRSLREIKAVPHVGNPSARMNPKLANKFGAWDFLELHRSRMAAEKKAAAERQAKSEKLAAERKQEEEDKRDALRLEILELAEKNMPVREIAATIQAAQRNRKDGSPPVTIQFVTKTLRDAKVVAMV